jgi:hypothetical protein
MAGGWQLREARDLAHNGFVESAQRADLITIWMSISSPAGMPRLATISDRASAKGGQALLREDRRREGEQVP